MALFYPTLLRADFWGDRSSWSKLWVFSYTGPLPRDPEMPDRFDEPEVIRQCLEVASLAGYHCASQGPGDPGGRYANEPRISVYQQTITIEQSGGLDI